MQGGVTNERSHQLIDYYCTQLSQQRSTFPGEHRHLPPTVTAYHQVSVSTCMKPQTGMVKDHRRPFPRPLDSFPGRSSVRISGSSHVHASTMPGHFPRNYNGHGKKLGPALCKKVPAKTVLPFPRTRSQLQSLSKTILMAESPLSKTIGRN